MTAKFHCQFHTVGVDVVPVLHSTTDRIPSSSIRNTFVEEFAVKVARLCTLTMDHIWVILRVHKG